MSLNISPAAYYYPTTSVKIGERCAMNNYADIPLPLPVFPTLCHKCKNCLLWKVCTYYIPYSEHIWEQWTLAGQALKSTSQAITWMQHNYRFML